MQKQTLRTVAVLSLLLMLTAVSVVAQSSRRNVATIPFSFTVGEKTLPAGEYTVEQYRRNSDAIWLVQSRDRRESVLVTTQPVRANGTQGKSSLVFRKYGDQYFLSQIWTGGGNSGRELRVRRSKDELAKNKTEQHTIVLAIGLSGQD